MRYKNPNAPVRRCRVECPLNAPAENCPAHQYSRDEDGPGTHVFCSRCGSRFQKTHDGEYRLVRA